MKLDNGTDPADGDRSWEYVMGEPPAELPSRDDAFARWLRVCREAYPQGSREWGAVDEVLNEYRLRADYGIPLSEELPEGSGSW